VRSPLSRTGRRAAVASVVTAAAVVAGVVAIQPGAGAAPLRQHSRLTIGAAISNSHLGDSAYVNTWKTEFSGVTPENEMKWDATEPSQGQFRFGAADTIVAQAQSAGMRVRGHTLVWHAQLPSWAGNITNASQLQSVMDAHIRGVAGHFAGKIWYWDVVNEAFADDGAGSRRSNSVFQRVLGDGYIEHAFRTARAADPAAKLCYNDYNTQTANAKSNAIYNMVRDFKARGVPIDCVGFQTHLGGSAPQESLRSNFQRFADLGVDVQVTELDDSTGSVSTEATDFANVIRACLAVSRCNNVTFWGVTDKYSWISGQPLMFDGNYTKKASYNSVHDALAATGGPTSSPTSSPTASTSPPPAGSLTPGSAVSLRATTSCCTDRYVRHQNDAAITSVITSGSSTVDKADATFVVRSGLASGSCVSFESRNYPGSYLRHRNYIVYRQASDGSAQFNADATFCPQGAKAGSGVSLASYNFSNRFLRHYGNTVYIASNGGSNAFDNASSWAADVTWAVTTPWA
jgi:endo-1,4-beta-xylanase